MSNTDQQYYHKPLSKLTDEEREKFSSVLANTLEEGFRKWGFSSFSDFIETLNKGAIALVEYLKFFLNQQEELCNLIKIPIGLLSEVGWYPSWYMTDSDTVNAAILLKENRFNDLTCEMEKFYKEHESDIEDQICKNFPSRSRIIKTAFKAHHREEYELSIPIMLAQADGICLQLIQKSLYSKKEGLPITSEFAEQFTNDAFHSAILEPLRRVGEISANTRDLVNPSKSLNRHGILHGTIVDYATKENSYKAVSLLSYVSELVYDIVKTKTTQADYATADALKR